MPDNVILILRGRIQHKLFCYLDSIIVIKRRMAIQHISSINIDRGVKFKRNRKQELIKV